MREALSRGLLTLALACLLPHSARAQKVASSPAEPAAAPRGGAAADRTDGADPRKAAGPEAPRARPRGEAPLRSGEREKASKANYDLGVRFGMSGRYAEAIVAFRDALLYMPNNADARFGLGHALYDSGRWAEAAEAFAQVVRLDPKDTQAHTYLGASLFRMGQYERAVEAYKKAVLIEPRSADVRHNIANAFFRLGRYEPAVLYYKEVTMLRPKSAAAYADMGAAYGEWGKYGEAAEALRRANAQEEEDAFVHNNLGLAQLLLGRRQDASKAFERALRLAPDDRLIRANAALLASAGGAVTANASLKSPAGVARWLNRTEVIRGVEETRPAKTAPAAQPPALQPSPTPARPAVSLAQNVKPAPSESAARQGGRAAEGPRPLTRETTARPAANAPVEQPAPARGEAVAAGGPATKGTPSGGASPDRTAAEGAEAAAPSANEAAGAAAAEAPYRVGVGDVLDVKAPNDTAGKSTLYTVLAGGLLEYPAPGKPFKVEGLTAEEISGLIASALREGGDGAGGPEVSVSVRDYVSHTVIVSGLVAQPGAKVLRREAIPLYVVIADAQPLPEAARVVVNSYATGGRSEVSLDDFAALAMPIRTGDVISVLARQAQFYYLGGRVSAPGQKEFHAGITLTQAILAAGGRLHSTKTALVARPGAGGKLDVLKFDLEAIMSGAEPDPALQPGDRVEVVR